MSQDYEDDEPRMYYPTQDEINLLQDILDFINLIYNINARWCCKGCMIDLFYIMLREGKTMDATFEEDGKNYFVHAWADIKGDKIQVYVGPEKKENAIQQTFKNPHPFIYGEYGAVQRPACTT